ncbi:MAG TPA: hypothetical protein VG963_34580 [Polyangiaceae bacterium]|nr:hypothetical protein [Polyangiaceae bacterium]
MNRKGQWMIIPRPFPPPTITFASERKPRARARPTGLRLLLLRFYLRPWCVVAGSALVSALAVSLAWLALRALR